MASPKKLKVLFVTSELFPFMKTGGLADVSAALPQKLTELGHEVRIVVPKYGAIDSRKFKIHDVVRLKDLAVRVGKKDVSFSVRSSFLPSQKARVQIYFIDNDEYFASRKGLYVDPVSGKPYPDNDERFSFLNIALFELIQKLGWTPDILHINDWQCGLIPVYLKTVFHKDPLFSKLKVLYTVHNFAEQGIFTKSSFQYTGLPASLNTEKQLLHNGKLNFLKGGLLYADAVNTVSEGYAKQVLSDGDFSDGLHKVISKRKGDFFGVINGIDEAIWNPEKDSFIPKKFSAKNLSHKDVNKRSLVERFGLPYQETTPVIGIVTRLYEYKGLDLLVSAFKDIMKLGVQLVLLGTGEKKLQTALEKFAKQYPQKFSCYLGFSDEVAHLIEAGSDMFLMPSRFEPCGLNQMYSLVYGTVPIVRETGGLADTVQRVSSKGEGNGFSFKEYTPAALTKEVERAVKMFQDRELWMKIMRNGMKCDFSWHSSSKKYIELYRTVLAAS